MKVLKNYLRTFKLSGMVNSVEDRINIAHKDNQSHLQLLKVLCEDEASTRQENSYKKRYNKAKLPGHKTLEIFDFSFQPSINEKEIHDLATGRYIDEKKNIVFVGSPGTGKTHLATALAIKALGQEKRVIFTSVSDMLLHLHASKADNSYYKKLQEYLAPDLLVLDELGFKRLPDYSVKDFFDVIAKRYENGSTIITTNKPHTQWHELFNDETLTTAILDRIMHHCYAIKINGKSYRAKHMTNIIEKA